MGTSQVLSLSGLALIVFSVFAFDSDTPVPSVYSLVPVIGTALVILFAVDGTIANFLLKRRVFIRIGLISYGAYLWHQPILAFSRHMGITNSELGFVLTAPVLLIVISFVSYRYIETPFRNKTIISTRIVWSAAVLSVLVLVLLSITTQYNDGFKNRFADSTHNLLDDIDENGDYVPYEFNLIRNIAFDEDVDAKNKIILIGDSFAMDIVNALQESQSPVSPELITHHISARCGNLYLDDFPEDVIDRSDRSRCDREGWFTDEVIESMLSADDIWLASSWKEWHLDYLKESLDNLDRDFSANVTVFGTKLFWDDDKTFSQILDLYESGEVISLPESAIQTNDEISQIALTSGVEFVDVLSLLCGDSSTCDLHESEAESLISVDGGHLTRTGAKRLAERLPSSIMGYIEQVTP